MFMMACRAFFANPEILADEIEKIIKNSENLLENIDAVFHRSLILFPIAVTVCRNISLQSRWS